MLGVYDSRGKERRKLASASAHYFGTDHHGSVLTQLLRNWNPRIALAQGDRCRH